MFNENEHPRDNNGKFAKKNDGDLGEQSDRAKSIEAAVKDFKGLSAVQAKQKILNENEMTLAERIASVHIDFTKDNILPKLNEDTLVKLDIKNNKQILLKAAMVKRNLGKHIDVSEKMMQQIIAETLYNPIDVFPANPNNSNYYHMASFVEIDGKDGLKMGLVLLDIDKKKEYFEVGHAYFVDGSGFKKAKSKAQKKD